MLFQCYNASIVQIEYLCDQSCNKEVNFKGVPK